jgi:hypothetical protein
VAPAHFTVTTHEHIAGILSVFSSVTNVPVNILYLENLYLSNYDCGQGINLEHNLVAKLYHIADDGGYFSRGAVALSGGYSTYICRDITVGKFHFELDTPGDSGSGASYEQHMTGSYITADYFSYSKVENVDAASTVAFDHVVAQKWVISNGKRDGTVTTEADTFTDCDFVTAGSDSYMQYPNNTIFTRCSWTCNYSGTYAYAFGVNGASHVAAAVTLEFDDCEFIKGASAGGITVGVGSIAAFDRGDVIFDIHDCTWTGAFTGCAGGAGSGNSGAGGYWKLGQGNTYSGTYLHRFNNSATYTVTLEIDGTDCIFTGLTSWLFVVQARLGTQYYYCKNVAIPQSINTHLSTGDGGYSYWCGANIEKAQSATTNGVMRTITGSGAPVDGTTVGMTSNDVAIGNSPDSFDIYYDSVGESYYQCYNEASKLWQAYSP